MLPELIRAHKRTYRKFSAAVRAYGDLDQKAKVPAARIVIGEMVDYVDDTRRPLCVVSYGELNDHAPQRWRERNRVPCCAACNCRKADQHPAEWLQFLSPSASDDLATRLTVLSANAAAS